MCAGSWKEIPTPSLDGQTSVLLHFGSGLGLARDSAVWGPVSDETTQGRADQIKPTIWSICRM